MNPIRKFVRVTQAQPGAPVVLFETDDFDIETRHIVNTDLGHTILTASWYDGMQYRLIPETECRVFTTPDRKLWVDEYYLPKLQG